MSRHGDSRRLARGRHGGFPLIEMMIVITIIGMLASLVLAGLNSARTSAKIAKTKTLVTRLHYIIMDKYDSYRTRRPAMDLEAYAKTHGYGFDLATGRVYPRELARARVNAIRDLIRMEMPDRWTDVTDGSLLTGGLGPSLSQRYLRLYKAALKAAGGDPDKLAEHAAAECLYMIVMSIPDAAEQFHASEVGDVDNDGLPEFIDAWGRPVRFLRWPAGFIPPAADTNLQDVNTPDPFDPRNVMGVGYALYPLIYSAGPDGEYDINIGLKGEGDSRFPWPYGPGPPDPFQDDGNGKKYGLPLNNEASIGAADEFTDLQHYDNIHNHRIETGRGGS